MLASGSSDGKLLRLITPVSSFAAPTTRKLASVLSTAQPSGSRIETSFTESSGPVAGATVLGSSVGLVSSVGELASLEDGDSGGPSPSGSSSSLQPVTSRARHRAAQAVHLPENTTTTLATLPDFPSAGRFGG